MISSNKSVLFKVIPLLLYKSEEDVYIGAVLPQDLYKVARFLRDSSLSKHQILTAISGVDYPQQDNRFGLVYELLSLDYNHRFRLKTYVNETTTVQSLVSLYPSANWWERETWDLFGVFFEAHPDLRRILSDYGFIGHPLCKDFPLSGYIDLRYNENTKQVGFENLFQDQQLRQSFGFKT